MAMIDKLDVKLISELQKNGRESYLNLGKRIGVVEGTIRKRFRRLIEKEVIKVAAAPNLKQLGFNIIGITAIQVNMEDLPRAAERLAKDERVSYIASVAGRYDLIAIIVAKSTDDLADFYEHRISSLAGLQRSETFVALRVFKGSVPLADTIGLIETLGSSLEK
jgi:Lrp/AsnC family transcriptional regulator for asnA, asnC and gidA